MKLMHKHSRITDKDIRRNHVLTERNIHRASMRNHRILHDRHMNQERHAAQHKEHHSRKHHHDETKQSDLREKNEKNSHLKRAAPDEKKENFENSKEAVTTASPNATSKLKNTFNSLRESLRSRIASTFSHGDPASSVSGSDDSAHEKKDEIKTASPAKAAPVPKKAPSVEPSVTEDEAEKREQLEVKSRLGTLRQSLTALIAKENLKSAQERAEELEDNDLGSGITSSDIKELLSKDSKKSKSIKAIKELLKKSGKKQESSEEVKEVAKKVPAKKDISKIEPGTKEFEQIAKKYRNAEDIKREEEKYTDNLEALHRIFTDGLISQESYDEKKKLIEQNIAKLEESVTRSLEKDELDTLRDKLEAELRNNLSAGSFSVEQKKYQQDIDALTKILDIGLISKKEYSQKKKELDAKMKKSDTIVLRIDNIFEEYKKELIDRINENVSDVETSKRMNLEDETDSSLSDSRNGIVGKIRSLFGISKKTRHIFKDSIVAKMREIKNTQRQRDALVKCSFILKAMLEEKLGIKDEHTYNQLIEKLPSCSLDISAQQSLIHFFKKISTGEYKDELPENELPVLLEEVERLGVLVERMKEKEELEEEKKTSKKVQKKAASPQEKSSGAQESAKEGAAAESPKKSSGVLSKVNNFFGV